MRRDDALLQEIVRTAGELATAIGGSDEAAFIHDDTLRSAAMYKLIVIDEAANKLSTELTARYSEVPWPAIISFRNRATHAYFAVDWSNVYEIATADVPQLATDASRMLEFLRRESAGSD